MKTPRIKKSKKEEYIDILLDGGNFTHSDLPYLNNLTTDQLRILVTREDDELVEDPEMVGFTDD